MEEKKRNKIIIFSIVVAILFLMAYLTWAKSNTDKGNYDYCIEWERLDDEGLRMGTLHRDSLIYNCYSLASQTFFCDYKIQDDGMLMIKPILNITKDNQGFITEIIYDEPNYFNCTRWLKSSEDIK